MATTKEAICICMDVGVSMKSQIVERSESDGVESETTYFKRAIALFTKLIERKVFSESKDEVCIVLFGTDETQNNLADEMEGQYTNVTTMCRLRTPTFELIEMMHEVSPSEQSEGDFLDAVVVGLDLLHKCTQGKKFARQRIFLFSAFLAEFDDDADGLADIKQTLVNVNAELSVIGLDSMGGDGGGNDEQNGHTNETSTPSTSAPSTSRVSHRPPSNSNNYKLLTNTQKRAIKVMEKLHEGGAVEGAFYSYADVTQVLQFFLSKESKVTGWNVNLELGSTQIPVTRFIRVKEARLKTWQKLSSEQQAGDANDPSDDSSAALKTTRTYYIISSEADAPKVKDGDGDATNEVIRGEEKEVDVDKLVKGYRYGSTLIPVTDADEEQMKLTDGAKCLRIIGFAKLEQIAVSDVVGDSSWIFVAQEGNRTASIALSALIRSCIDLDRVIIVRYAYNKASNPRMVVLIPRVDETAEMGGEYLVGVQLPFADDLRMFTLPSFDQIASVDQLRPSNEQQSAMDQLVSSARVDADDLEHFELYQSGTTFNPYLQRTYQCLSHKRLYPEEDLPDVDRAITASLQPHESIIFGAAASIDQMDSLFETKVVEKVKPSTGQNLFMAKSGDGTENINAENEVANRGSDTKYAKLENITSLNNVGNQNGTETLLAISSKTPNDDFKKMLDGKETSNGKQSNVDYSAECKKCEDKAIEFITNSFNDEFFAKAHELILCYRSEAIKRGFVSSFNSFLINLRDLLKSRRKENFLDVLKESKTSLINDSESDLSNITIAEASAFNDGDAFNTSSLPRENSCADVTDENYDDASDLLALLD